MKLNTLRTLLAATTVFSSTALAALYSSSGAGPMLAPRPSILYFGHALIPHPDKIHRGGEDAYFVSHALQAFGVADGVGAWSNKGIDPGKFSRSIMQFVEHAIFSEEADDKLTPVQALRASFNRVLSRGLQGSCTALVARLRGRVLHVANLGDSGIIILRPNKAVGEDAFPYDSMCRRKQTSALLLQAPGGVNPYGLGNKPDKKIDSKTSFRIIYRSKEQQHYFNCPFQLDLNGNDAPEKADVSSHELVEGDVVIAGSDGLFDNLFDSDIAALASLSSDPQELSYILATQAQQQANHSKGARATPFAVNAMEAGWKTSGGKLDDIAVIVGMFAKAPVDEKRPLSKL